MAVEVVLVERARIPSGVEFPPLEAPRCGFLALTIQRVADRCGRSATLVRLCCASRRDEQYFQKLPRLQLLMAAVVGCGAVGTGLARPRKAELAAFQKPTAGDIGDGQTLCQCIVQAGDQYLARLEDRENHR